MAKSSKRTNSDIAHHLKKAAGEVLPHAVAAALSHEFYQGVARYFAMRKLPFPELPAAAEQLEAALSEVSWELRVTKFGFMIRKLPSDGSTAEPMDLV